MVTPSATLVRIIQRLPYPNQISYIDWTDSPNSLLFEWRGRRWRVDDNLVVWEINDNGFLDRTSAALLMECLFKGEIVTLGYDNNG